MMLRLVGWFLSLKTTSWCPHVVYLECMSLERYDTGSDLDCSSNNPFLDNRENGWGVCSLKIQKYISAAEVDRM
ncbi:hypothetical protein I7I53_03677 [Histoplasma capsulatum var. duboisii H88]|uniref:Secreted protein n=1 Tax=Ajellomyces capsulatus (strain H88) TaxID=544711 RepID=A0A8A1LT24_AJEC8|nr:hypothetical protein I7I53_03677 [Histoplasma capsulatum var. duboisii H88]